MTDSERLKMIDARLQRIEQMIIDQSPKRPMRPAEAAEYYRVNVQTIYRWIEDGKIPAHKHGRSYLIYSDEVKDSNALYNAEK